MTIAADTGASAKGVSWTRGDDADADFDDNLELVPTKNLLVPHDKKQSIWNGFVCLGFVCLVGRGTSGTFGTEDPGSLQEHREHRVRSEPQVSSLPVGT